MKIISFITEQDVIRRILVTFKPMAEETRHFKP
jgi:hypothetical protein